ncbi:MAG: tetratricopeptide repeat protein [Candidatus Omnitrophota bacterium]
MRITTLKQKISLFFLGIFLSIILIESLLTLGGIIFLSLQEIRNWSSVRHGDSFRILCLGESTTAIDDGHSYPRQMETILNQRNIGITFSVINKGIPGIYTEGILARLNENLEKYKPDLVITMIGINDPLTEEKNHFLHLRRFKIYNLAVYLLNTMTNKKKSFGSGTIAAGELMIDPEEGNPTFLGVAPESFEYYSSGEKFVSQGDFEQAKKMYELSIQADPRNHEAYSALAGCYIYSQNYVKAEEIYEINKRNNPENIDVYDDLAEIYFLQNRYEDMERILRAALDLNPFYVKAYLQLGHFNRLRGEFGRAEKILNEALLKMPSIFHGDIYTEMSLLYLSMGKFQEVEYIHKKALKVNPDNDHLYGMIGVYHLESGDDKTADKYFTLANRIRERHYNPQTALNYQKIRSILAQKGIKHVAMQYAMRDVELLKKILGNHHDILFVDNRPAFLQGIKTEGYNQYFTDRFGGDFGHCTEKGDRLIAENAANAIIERYFK